jgi:hypothetical protein
MYCGMPLEIKELLIRVTVNEARSAQRSNEKAMSPIDMKALIDTCVNKVLEKIESKSER